MTFRFLRVTPAGEPTGRECWAGSLAEARWILRSNEPGSVVSAASHAVPRAFPEVPPTPCTTCGKLERFEGRAVCEACHRADQLRYYHKRQSPKRKMPQCRPKRHHGWSASARRKSREVQIKAGIARRAAKRNTGRV